MTIYYSATERAFLFSDVHGEKTVMIRDPNWDYPLKEVPDPDWVGDDEDDRPMIEVPDTSAECPLVEALNPRFPSDAVEVSEADYAALMKAQDEYSTIEPDAESYPRAVPATDERLSEIARLKRDGLLTSTDWTQATDVPEATREKYAAYRQALRDVPSQPGFPRNIEWPEHIK